MADESGVLDQITGPCDLKRLSPGELTRLAGEIRAELVAAVARYGGHLGSNLGVVELTIALHRVFDSPRDRLLFDTGHQAYVHKMLTGRRDLRRLRSRGGLSGYPCRAESEHDVLENSHASTALSYADGLAKAYRLSGEDRRVVAVVGDGALTGGMAWEALNNIGGAGDRPVIIVVNDNGRSYSPTAGGLADHLARLREGAPGRSGGRAPRPVFEELGVEYLGPVDGHDEAMVEAALRRARALGRPVLVHCVTTKGYGYPPAEDDPVERFHAPGRFDPATGRKTRASGRSWTEAFSAELVEIGAEDPHIVAITAAMLHPTGLAAFQAAFPERTYDVGIAEQHAVASAAGLALGGAHPVVAVYSTFLNRAFDQVLMDVALHRLGVTFVLDRAGITGDDGPSHNGMWDLSILQVVPGLRVAAPRDAARLRGLLREAVAVDDAPTVVRFPKGELPPETDPVAAVGAVDVLARDGTEDVLIVAVGPFAGLCLEVAERLGAQGVGVTVVDPRWVQPIDPAVTELAGRHRLVAVVEDNGRVGGVGDAVARLARDAGLPADVHTFGIPQRFLEHAPRTELLAEIGLRADDLAGVLGARLAGPRSKERETTTPILEGVR
ncbi:1-deoxy-D-xylulose-5-phosphate synthase [Microbispora triticiradicis]|uniref:1-deoxy-D-xylulose-5-phosphate synthase n=2 Tax=Microbispora TaxID=2005 RepID=A0ABY3LN60_9ACTN|nr:1-deoxy-D-xylulose-5-phosphate synthase [Microbispora tritici]TLP50925.1 1-deoxy-D-xylulose-5-phosphate synthase [Microbispora fusca]TYB43826.1 1-deoxy-D-xylulose-5-phosphate synthase [Microbispora tritici]